MSSSHRYPIGISGQKWSDKERAIWLDQVIIKRSYQKEVVTKLTPRLGNILTCSSTAHFLMTPKDTLSLPLKPAIGITTNRQS